MRVLLLTQRFAPARTVAAARWDALVDHLRDRGVTVEVACQRYPADGLGGDARVVLEIARGEVVAAEDAGTTERSPAAAAPTPGAGSQRARAVGRAQRLLLLPTAALSWLRRWRDLRGTVAERDPDVIVASSPPHDLDLVAALLARRAGLPLVLDVRDPYVGDPRYDWPRIPPWRTVNRALERWYVRSAAAVMTAGASHAATLRARYPDRAARIHHVPNGFHPGPDPDPDRDAFGATAPPRPGDPVELAVVATAPRAELEVVLRGARLAFPDRSVRLRCFGLPEATVEALRPLAEVVATPWLEAARLGAALAPADILLLVLDPERATGGGTSTKLYQYLERGRPVLAVNPCAADVPLLERWATHRVLHRPDDHEAARALRELAVAEPVGDTSALVSTYGWPALADDVAEVLKGATGGVGEGRA